MAGGFDPMYEGVPPWDIGRPQPAFLRLADAGAIRGQVLDVGCGTGEHVLMLAARGVTAVGLDGSPRAIEKARAKADQRGVEAEFVVGDALGLAALRRTFDTVLDSGLFHVFDDAQRGLFVRGLHEVLRPGGSYFMLCFSDKEPGGWGPRRVRQKEIRAAFAQGWRVHSIEASFFEANDRARGGAKAWLASVERL